MWKKENDKKRRRKKKKKKKGKIWKIINKKNSEIKW